MIYLEIKIEKLFDVNFSILIFFFNKKYLIFILKKVSINLEEKNIIVDDKTIKLSEI